LIQYSFNISSNNAVAARTVAGENYAIAGENYAIAGAGDAVVQN
jgi:hypothetical protein